MLELDAGGAARTAALDTEFSFRYADAVLASDKSRDRDIAWPLTLQRRLVIDCLANPAVLQRGRQRREGMEAKEMKR